MSYEKLRDSCLFLTDQLILFYIDSILKLRKKEESCQMFAIKNLTNISTEINCERDGNPTLTKPVPGRPRLRLRETFA
jgi:hypothetical protein